MTTKPFNEQAALLVENCLDLIKQVLVKHTAAVLEEMRDQIVSRNDRIKHLESQLAALISDKNEYCEVLRVLGMEEEGNAVAEIIRLLRVERDLTLSVEVAKKVTSELEAERDALKREYVNRCPHEWYQGRCIHCDVAAKDGKPA